MQHHAGFALGLLSLAAWFISPASTPANAAVAKDTKEEKKPEPPRVVVTLPLAVRSGMTNKLTIRGQNLTNVVQLRFTNDGTKVEASIISTGKADVPKEADAKKIGDTQIELELALPMNSPASTNYFTLISTNGSSQPQALVFLPPGRLVEEMEPNGGFKPAQLIEVGKTVSGVIKEAGDVDVFRFQGKAGQKLAACIYASVGGSSLDSLLTLYHESGRILASNDDGSTNTVDSAIQFRLPGDGDYRIAIQDAHDRGGPTHVYLLEIRMEK